MESANVLSLYFEIINGNFHHLKFHIASNSVLDWFGQSVRGPAKILEFLRYDVCTQYVHHEFDALTECSAIEYKPAHMKTKLAPNTSARNRVKVATLKTRADSDFEDEDVEMLHGTSQDALLTNGAAAPSSDNEYYEVKAKRLKRSDSVTELSTAQKLKQHAEMSSDDDEHPPKELGETTSYSALRYFEATGTLHAKPDMGGYGDPSVSAMAGVRAGKVRVRISYRRNLTDHTPQIALIIYDNPERPSLRRRNLGLEFEQMPCDEATDLSAEEPALVTNDAGELIVSTVETPTSETIAAALVNSAFRTPTKTPTTTPSTLQRQPRSKLRTGRLSLSKSGEKSSAARNLRL